MDDHEAHFLPEMSVAEGLSVASGVIGLDRDYAYDLARLPDGQFSLYYREGILLDADTSNYRQHWFCTFNRQLDIDQLVILADYEAREWGWPELSERWNRERRERLQNGGLREKLQWMLRHAGVQVPFDGEGARRYWYT